MGSLFSKPKTVKPPPVAPPEPVPDPAAEAAAEAIRREKKVKGSRRKTFVTGELEPSEDALGKKTSLG